VQGIALPSEQDAFGQVRYVAGALNNSPHTAAAAEFIGFLGSQPGQDAYVSYGFLPATGRERRPHPLPAN
jgi:ABC-type molybdate transport system substrate-binding protein